MAEWPSGTVTFLFTDLEGSTQRWQQYPTAMGPALARHDRLLRDAISAHGGVVFKTVGDAVCAAFATGPSAVAAALAAQRALYNEPWGATGPLRVRMALHTGQAEAQAGDYLGGPLNRVARLLSLGHGDQILLSGPTADLVDDYLPPGVTLRDMGMHKLKDVTRPEHVFQLVAPDLPADFAPLASVGTAAAELFPTVDAEVPPAARRKRSWSLRRPAIVVVTAVAVLAGAWAAVMAAGWIGSNDSGRAEETPALAVAATSQPTDPPAPTPTMPPTTTATATATVSMAATPPAEAGAAATGPGQIVYTVYEGQPGFGRVFRLAAREGAVPEDVSAALDALAPAAPDEWIAISPDGSQLIFGTERFDPECVGWPCLAVAPADLATAELVRIDGELMHLGGPGVIVGDLIVFPSVDGPHESDLWATRRQGASWGAPLLLTEASPYAFHAGLSVAADGAMVVFECGNRPYGEAGTALCEVGTDGSGFRVALTPTDAAAGVPATAALRLPSYAPDGAILFEASWDSTVWRLPPGAALAESVGPGYDSDGAPCALSDGRIASLWLGRPESQSHHEVKVMTADGTAHTMLLTGTDVAQISCGG